MGPERDWARVGLVPASSAWLNARVCVRVSGRPEAFMRRSRWRREATALERRADSERGREGKGREEGVRTISPSRLFRCKNLRKWV